MTFHEQFELLGRHPDYLALKGDIETLPDERKEILSHELEGRRNHHGHLTEVGSAGADRGKNHSLEPGLARTSATT